MLIQIVEVRQFEFNQRHKVEKFIRIAKKVYSKSNNKYIGDSRQVFKVLNEINGKTARQNHQKSQLFLSITINYLTPF